MRAVSELEHQRLHMGACPACGTVGLIAGPRGGLSRNWYCEACHSAFNLGHTSARFLLHEVFFIQPIEWPDDNVIDIYRDDVPRKS